MATKAQQSYIRPVVASVAEGATTPDPGTTNAVLFSTSTGMFMRWTGTVWTSATALVGNATSTLRLRPEGSTDDDGELVITNGAAGTVLTLSSETGSSADVNLYRSAANVLKTDDLIDAALGFTTTRSSGSTAYLATVTGDTQNRFRVDTTGKIEWSSGTNVTDTNLYRGGADQLFSDDRIWSQRQTNVDNAFSARVTGDGQPRYNVVVSGKIEWGDGTNAADTNLYRSAADTLKTDDNFNAAVSLTTPIVAGNGTSLKLRPEGATDDDGELRISNGGAGTLLTFTSIDGALADVNLYRVGADLLKTDDSLIVGGTTYLGSGMTSTLSADTTYMLLSYVTGDTAARFGVTAGGRITFGPGGSTAADTNLYRSAADTLKTDDTLLVAQKLGLGATTSPSAHVHVTDGTFAAMYLQKTGTNAGTFQIYNDGYANIVGPGSSPDRRFSFYDQMGAGYPNDVFRPPFCNYGDTNTGIYFPDNNDKFAVTTGGTERLRIDDNGNVGIATTSSAATAKLDVNSDAIRLRTAKTPASASATGNAGDICWDANYVYVCTATNTWKRAALSTW